MATASKSFTATGTSGELLVRHGESFTYDVSGTFVGTVVLQQRVGKGGWDPLVTSAVAASGTIVADAHGKAQARYRYHCPFFVSGTIVTAIADVTSEVTQSVLDANELPLLQFSETGVTVPSGKTLTATSANLITPTLGVATATTVNKVTITAPATAATLTVIQGTTLTGPAATDTLVGRASTDTLTNKTLTTPTVTSPLVTTPKGPVHAIESSFTETTGAGTYTAAVTVPAGATILDIIVNGVALWDATTSALMDVGDVTDPDGYFTQINLKATDLLAGESVSFAFAGAKAGAYIANSQVSPRYLVTARVVSGIIITVGAAGTLGRTRMTVVYHLPVTADIVAATKV